MPPKSKAPPPKQPKARFQGGVGRFSIRLLPVTIFVVSLMLSVRVNDLWRAISGSSVATLSVAEAQQPPPPGGRTRGQKTPADQAPLAPTAPAASTAPAPAATNAPAPAASAAPAPVAVPPMPANDGEPPTFTQNEIDVLQKLSGRRETLDARERDLNLRENMIKAAESRIDKKIAEMKGLQSSVESMLKQVDDQDQTKMKSLVKIYENMKPKDAAKIFNELDMPVLLGVLSLMKEQKIALIMEAMDPSKAKELTDAMAQKRTARIEGR